MKRLFKNKIFKAPVAVIAVTCLLFVFSSCLKNNQYYYDLKDVGASIDMPLAAFNTNAVFALALDVADTPTTYPVYVNVASPQVLGKSVTATLGLDTAYLDQYNVANGTDYEVLPDSDYSIGSWDLTVPAKQRLAYTNVKIYTNKMDASHNYVLPLTIVKASLPIENWNHLLINVTAKNQFDGKYTVTGTFVDMTNAAFTALYPKSVSLVTQGANSVAYYDNDLGGFGYLFNTGSGNSYYGNWAPVFTIDNNGNVISVTNYYNDPAPRSRQGQLDPTGVNKYDFSTKTMQVSYYMLQAGNKRCHFVETFVYKGPR